MENRKESEIIERISELTGKPKSTLYDWKKNEKNIKLYEALKEFVELKENKCKDINNNEDINELLTNALNKLPDNKKKKFYYLIMAELTEIEE